MRVMLIAGMLMVATPALAEEITVTAYYPSPRGVYKELEATKQISIRRDGGRARQLLFSFGNSTGKSNLLRFNRARGTEADPQPVSFDVATGIGDLLGVIRFLGFNDGNTGTDPDDSSDNVPADFKYGDAAAIKAVVDGQVASDDVPGRLAFFTHPPGQTGGVVERMRITSRGNVAIGTTTPRTGLKDALDEFIPTLDIDGITFFGGGDDAVGITGVPLNPDGGVGIEQTDLAMLVPTYAYPGGPVPGTGISDLRLYIEDNAVDRFSIWGNSCAGSCQDLNTSTEAHRFKANGDVYHAGQVGIGTENPRAPLEIVSADGAIGSIGFAGKEPPVPFLIGDMWFDGGTDALFTLTNLGVNTGDPLQDATRFRHVDPSTGDITNIMELKNTGNVGIGTTTPAATLDVNGLIRGEPECRTVIDDSGSSPTYVSVASCAADEWLLTGGGACQVTSPPGLGYLHASHPTIAGVPEPSDPPGPLPSPLPLPTGWTVDCFNPQTNGDVPSMAYAVCCKKGG